MERLGRARATPAVTARSSREAVASDAGVTAFSPDRCDGGAAAAAGTVASSRPRCDGTDLARSADASLPSAIAFSASAIVAALWNRASTSRDSARSMKRSISPGSSGASSVIRGMGFDTTCSMTAASASPSNGFFPVSAR